MVVVKGILAGHSVGIPNICPAASLVPRAIVEAQPDDIYSYVNALIRLWDNQAFYRLKQAACAEYQGHFYDLSQGWGEALKQGLTTLSLVPVNSFSPVLSMV